MLCAGQNEVRLDIGYAKRDRIEKTQKRKLLKSVDAVKEE